MWSCTLAHNHMKSVVCRTPKTMSGNVYIIFGLWNHSPASSHWYWLDIGLLPSCPDAILNIIFPLYILNTDFFAFLITLNVLWTSKYGQTLLAGRINTTVKKIIPLWTNRLHMVQLELISAILDGQDILCCTATGDGKLAAFSIPCLVLLLYNQHPESYPTNLPTRSRPIGHTNKGISQQYCMFTFSTLSVTNNFLGEQTSIEAQHICFLLLPWNPQQGAKCWSSFGVRDHGMH